MFGQADAELLEEGFLLSGRLGNASQTDLMTVGGGQDDVGAVQGGKQSERPHRRKRLSVIDSARRWLRHNRGSALQQMFQRDPESVAQERHQDVSLDARLQLVKQRPDRKLALQRPEGRFGFDG